MTALTMLSTKMAAMDTTTRAFTTQLIYITLSLESPELQLTMLTAFTMLPQLTLTESTTLLQLTTLTESTMLRQFTIQRLHQSMMSAVNM